MIYCYTGTPGSGKSLHSMERIVVGLRNGQNVITNFPVDLERLKKHYKPNKKTGWGKFIYKDNNKLTVRFLIDFAKRYHKHGIEKQTLLIIDEAQVKFDSRDFRDKDRKAFNIFFAQHRKLGYSCILITQSLRFLDRRIRECVEYEVKHRVANNFGLGKRLPFKLFVAITKWVTNNEKLDSEFYFYKAIYADLYDSYGLFDLDSIAKECSG